VVLALNELPNTVLAREARHPVCPDCFADMHDVPAAEQPDEGLRHRCTRCGAGWERSPAGWLFPLGVA
jgi:hypothetical protein